MSSLGFHDDSETSLRGLEFSTSTPHAAANENRAPVLLTNLDGSRTMENGLEVSLGDGRSLRPSANLFNWQAKAKRSFDILLSLAAILVFAPLFALVALAIMIESRGPVLFVQEREGKAGRSFRAFKFRSMRQDDCDLTGVRQTVVGDSRVTKVGSFLRRTSIDELPQLLNVLIGDMSLVGPRPHVRGMLAGGQEYRTLVPYYDLRLLVAPGLTGWAQANGLRGPTTNAELARRRVDHDLAYIEEFSFWLDLKIIMLTLKREFFGGSGH